MVKPLRIEYLNAWYHVMNRGRRGEEDRLMGSVKKKMIFAEMLVWAYKAITYHLTASFALNFLLKQSKAVKQQIHSDIDFFSSIIIGYNI